MNKGLFKLIGIVFVISWIGVLPSLLISYGIDIPPALEHLDILMTLGPIIGATIYIAVNKGKAGLKNLFKRLLYFKASPLLLLVAIGFPVLESFIGSYLGLILSDSSWPAAFDLQTILINGLVVSVTYLVINTEEIVWRGVVFDQLIDRFSYIKACLIIAPIWWLFHMPLFLYPEGHPAGYGLGIFSIIVVAQTFILGWIYVNSNRSLFYVHIHHQLINGFGQAFPIFPIFVEGNQTPVWIFSLVLLLGSLVLVWFQKKTGQVMS